MSPFPRPFTVAAVIAAAALSLAACSTMQTHPLTKPTPTAQNPAQQQHFPNP